LAAMVVGFGEAPARSKSGHVFKGVRMRARVLGIPKPCRARPCWSHRHGGAGVRVTAAVGVMRAHDVAAPARGDRAQRATGGVCAHALLLQTIRGTGSYGHSKVG